MLKNFHLFFQQRLNFLRFQKARFLVLDSLIAKRKYKELKKNFHNNKVDHDVRKMFVNLYSCKNAKHSETLSHQNPVDIK